MNMELLHWTYFYGALTVNLDHILNGEHSSHGAFTVIMNHAVHMKHLQ